MQRRPPPAPRPPGLLPAAAAASRVLVLDLGFLGDTVHTLPAAWAVRQAFPRARLGFMCAAHVVPLLALCPWIDEPLGYPRYPRSPPLWRQGPHLRALRAGRWEAIVNLNGSDRSSLLTGWSGARWRLGRVPPRLPWFWKHCFTHAVATPFGAEPVFVQKWRAAVAAGLPGGDGPRFVATVPEAARAGAERAVGGVRGYLHVSPCTTQDHKELPLPVLAQALNGLAGRRPDLPIVLSGAPNDRERARLADLVARLHRPPAAVLAGSLDLPTLAAVIAGSRLHAGGDSGALHLALLTGRPSVAWFREYEDIAEWRLPPPDHVALVGPATPAGLAGIDADQLTGALERALDSAPSDRAETSAAG